MRKNTRQEEADSGSSEEEQVEEIDQEQPDLGVGDSEGESLSNENIAQEEGAEGKPLPDSKKRLDFDPSKNAPKLVVVQGPPKSGKTTLIRSLIKHYTNQNVADPKGPITVKTSKKQRVTFIECSNDLSQTLDMAKIPDVVFTMIDISIGFEMETFEFLSMLQIHGFPRCVGVATHLDFYKDNDRKKKVKKSVRRRFEK